MVSHMASAQRRAGREMRLLSTPDTPSSPALSRPFRAADISPRPSQQARQAQQAQQAQPWQRPTAETGFVAGTLNAMNRSVDGEYSGVDLRDPVEADIAYRVAVAWRELRRGAATQVLRDHFLGTGAPAIEQGQMDTLDMLAMKPLWRMSELAEALRVDPSTATRAVQRLVNDGLAERHTCGDDGRVVMVAASRAGRRRHAAVAKRRAAALSRLLAGFEPHERVQLAALLERFVDEIDRLVVDLAAAGEASITGPPAPAPTGPADSAQAQPPAEAAVGADRGHLT